MNKEQLMNAVAALELQDGDPIIITESGKHDKIQAVFVSYDPSGLLVISNSQNPEVKKTYACMTVSAIEKRPKGVQK